MRVESKALVLGAWLMGAVGCSSESDTGCNSLPNDGRVVTAVAATPLDAATIAPVGSGGRIPDGTYELTQATFDGPSSDLPDLKVQAVIQVAGNTMQQVGSVNGEEFRYTSTYSLSGSTITTTDSCPAADTSTDGFSLTVDQDLTRTGFIVRQSVTGGTLDLTHWQR